MSLRRLTIALILVTALSACDREQYIAPGAIPVKSEVVRRGDFVPVTTLLGVVRASQTIPLTVMKSGRVTYPRRFAAGLQTGAHISRGEVVAEIRNDQVMSARTQARLQMEGADADFERDRRGFEQGVTTGAQFSSSRVRAQLAHEQYDAAMRDAGLTRIIAPSGGTLIVTKPLAPGAMADAGTIVAQIAASGAPVVESSAPAAQRESLRPGLVVRFTAPGNVIGTGTITEVASVIDASGTARVVAAIAGPVVPPPGTGVELQVELDHHRDVLTVPEDAIVAAVDGAAVFVESTSEGKRMSRVKRVRVEIGGRANGRVEILSGLHDGDRVVVSGADSLTDDTIVLEAEESK